MINKPFNNMKVTIELTEDNILVVEGNGTRNNVYLREEEIELISTAAQTVRNDVIVQLLAEKIESIFGDNLERLREAQSHSKNKLAKYGVCSYCGFQFSLDSTRNEGYGDIIHCHDAPNKQATIITPEEWARKKNLMHKEVED